MKNTSLDPQSLTAVVTALFLGLTSAFVQAADSQPAAVFPGEQWREMSPESQGLDSKKLEAAVAFMESRFGPDGAKELVIIRNGYLIWKGPNADAYHNVWSCTKNFAASVLGLLISDGKCALDDPAIKYLAGLDDKFPAYSKINLRHLASMSSGYKGELVDVTTDQPWGDPMRYLHPAAPLYDAGMRVQYHDHQVFVLGEILTRLAGEPMKAVFERRIADPIGLTHWDWGVSGKVDGIDLNNAAGTPSKAPGVQITARQMARFGYLYLRGGNWNGKRLLPRSFVEEACRNQVPGVGASSFLHGRYGLYWWTNDVMPDGRRPWPAASPKTYTAHGHSCNFCFVIPEWDMVVVRMGTTPIGRIADGEKMWNTFFAILAEAMSPPAKTARVLNSKIMTMPDNSWLNLKPEGMAFARMYSCCCAGGGSLWYFGGAHRGYKGNDVQIYDPRANTWVQATEPESPEAGSADWKAMTGGGGTTTRLSPTGCPYTEHTYQQVCWEPERKRFFVVLVSSGTWEFNPVERRWIHLINRFEDRTEPRGVWAQNHVLYEPALKAPVLICGTTKPGIYRFDHEKLEWTQLGERPDDLAWNEFYSTYVPDWKCHLISTMKRGFFKFDVVNGTVTPIESPEALAGCQSLAYDTANRVVIALAIEHTDKRRQAVIPWALDIRTMEWTKLDPPKPWPEGQSTGRWAKLWYDAGHNVHLFVNDVRRDRRELFDGGVTETWAYRYKQPAR